MMRLRLACVLLLPIACGSSSQTGDAGVTDASAETPVGKCVADFPCFSAWSCADSTHWIATETQSCEVTCHTSNCTGESCGTTGTPQACPTGTKCVEPSPPMDGGEARCAFGGLAGCAAADESAFTPQPTTSPTKQASVCTDVEIQQFWSRCYEPSTYDENSCNYWKGLYSACDACLAPMFTYASFPTYQQLYAFPNVSGCYATLDGTAAPGSCAALEDSNLQCAIASCSSSCAATEDAFTACVAAARTTTCAAFPRCDDEASTSFATCSTLTHGDFYFAFGRALCGG